VSVFSALGSRWESVRLRGQQSVCYVYMCACMCLSMFGLALLTPFAATIACAIPRLCRQRVLLLFLLLLLLLLLMMMMMPFAVPVGKGVVFESAKHFSNYRSGRPIPFSVHAMLP
jgi:hypothetical protein